MSEAAVITRTARQVWAAPGSSHDRLIGTLRVVLPIAIGVLAAFVVVTPLFSSGDVSFVLDKNKVEVAKERMRTQSAVYRGEDGKRQPFVLNAGSAVQKSSAEPIVRLNDLSARLQLKDGPANLAAPSGAYDMTTEKIHVDGPVRFTAANGYRLDTSGATVDMKSRQMSSSGAVTGTVPQGQFSAGAMNADLDNHVVRLDGNARLRIVPHGTK
ncbi:MAG: LPS export ABC transporter periplasmic protein LptC [Pseudomonadota bacterium]|nr:LPS export ABC transporter periplasmic protein LptC [Pseudomonadota bacterium]